MPPLHKIGYSPSLRSGPLVMPFAQKTPSPVLAALALAALPVASFASEASHIRGYPRPFVDAVATVPVEGLGYRLPLYLAQGTNKEHYLHPPPIYLVSNSDEGEGLRADIEELNSGQGFRLILYHIRYSSHDEQIRKLAREELRGQSDSVKQIQTLPVHGYHFSSSGQPTIRSAPGPGSSSFLERNAAIPIYFDMGAKEDAENLLKRLRHGQEALVFHYTFRGVADAECKATYNATRDGTNQALREVTGDSGSKDGDVEYVSRNQEVEVAQAFIEDISIESRCKTPETAAVLIDKVIEQLASAKRVLQVPNWDDIEGKTWFDKNDFRANVLKKMKNIEKENIRNQVEDAFTRSGAEGSQWTLGGFFRMAAEIFGLGSGEKETGLSAGGGSQVSESEASRTFRDLIKQTGMLVEWDGMEYKPKVS